MATGNHFRLCSDHLLVRRHHRRAEGDGHLRTDAEAKVVLHECALTDYGRGGTESREYFCAGYGQALAGSDVEGDTFPSPGIDFQLQSREGLRVRVRLDTRFFQVTTETSTNQMLCLQVRNRFQNLDFFVADRLAISAYRRFHAEIRKNLE